MQVIHFMNNSPLILKSDYTILARSKYALRLVYRNLYALNVPQLSSLRYALDIRFTGDNYVLVEGM